MPSPSKHLALADAGFQLPPVCMSCAHWTPGIGGWGSCGRLTYSHEKHNELRQAGTPGIGSCLSHLPEPERLRRLVGTDYADRYTPENQA